MEIKSTLIDTGKALRSGLEDAQPEEGAMLGYSADQVPDVGFACSVLFCLYCWEFVMQMIRPTKYVVQLLNVRRGNQVRALENRVGQ